MDDFPISQIPGHPSRQTEHIPEEGAGSDTLFFVPVAALAFGLPQFTIYYLHKFKATYFMEVSPKFFSGHPHIYKIS